MAMIRSYNQPTVEGRPAPNALVPANAPVGAFGNAAQTEGNARATMQAGAYLERAADTTANMALSMMEDANEARVQELSNGFMSGSQFTLYTDKDAFYRKRGQDAINGAQGATDKLLELKKETVGLAANDTQRKRLEKILSAQIVDATNGISRHVSTQSMEWQKNVATARQNILLNQTSLQWNDFDAVEKNALAAESVAKEQARQLGAQPGDDVEKSMVATARSNHFSTAITQMIQNDQKRSALALYDKFKDRLDEKDNIRLASAIKSTRTEIEGEDWITRNAPNSLPQAVKQYAPLIQKASAEYGVDPALATAVMAGESGGNRTGNDGKPITSKAGAGGLMQIMPDTAKGLGVTDVHDPAQAIPGGVKYLSQQLGKFNGDTRLALMAYNWGPGNVEKWVKAGSDPAKVPQETRDYVQKVQGYVAAQGVGFDKANTGGLVLAAMNDPSLSTAVKTSIASRLNRESANMEATRTAQIKGLRDLGEATMQTMMVAPGGYKKGTLSDIADGLDAAGEKSEAANLRLIASREDTLLSMSQMPKNAQEETIRQIIAGLLPGKAKALAEGILAANKKDATDAAKMAGEDFAALKLDATNGVRMETMDKKARAVVDGFLRASDFTKAREAADWFDGQVKAQAAGQAPPAQLAAAIGDMRTRIESGEQTNSNSALLDAMRKTQQEQATALSKDALTAGSTIYSQALGPLPAASDLAARVAYAEQISQRQGGMKVLPFTEPEIAQIRTTLDNAPPEQQAKTMQALAQIPAEHIPGVAEALAGKGAGDQLSRSYAAALSFYADRDPASREVGNQILQGAKIIKDGGDGSRKPAATSDAWQSALQDRMGNLLRDADPRQMGVIADAVASVYVYQMNRAGRQGEKTDPDILDKAIKAVVGEPVVLHGQAMLPPVRGMGTYEVEKALRSMSDGDLDGVRTMEGQPVTAAVIQNRGVLTNGSKGEGWYFVRIPDPRAGGDLRPVLMPNGKDYLQIDLRPLIERAARFPEGLAPLPNEPVRARSRAPANPTEGLVP